ncbi:glycosyltransferase [Peribacillus frigoritolerans]|uniref:glycosyltransferase family protein n=2 Tax=Peribacillus TaxID=2675229 RepID=UPI00345CEB51
MNESIFWFYVILVQATFMMIHIKYKGITNYFFPKGGLKKKMTLLKILYITKDYSKHLERNPFYLSQELSKVTELFIWHQPGNIQTILSQIAFTPDFILLNDMTEIRCPKITGLTSTKIPIGIVVYDIHHFRNERKQFIIENNIKHIFSICRDAFHKWYPEFVNKMRWLPHFVNTNIFKEYGLKKEIDLLMLGMVRKDYYPFRTFIFETFKDKPGFVYKRHPGYLKNTDLQKNVLSGVEYAKEINRAKIFITCDSVFHYPLIKYYEVLASGTLLLAPTSKELEDLGFLPGIHFVPINYEDVKIKAEYYLLHEEERKKITQAGYKFVREKHSATHRALQLLNMIKNILATY